MASYKKGGSKWAKSWHKITSTIYELDGSYLAIIPDAVGAFIIVDSRKPGKSLGGALELKTAKEAAQHLALNDKYKREG